MSIKSLTTLIQNLLFPSQCIICGKYNTPICQDCKNCFFQKQQHQQCHVCKYEMWDHHKLIHRYCKTQTNLDGVYICYRYSKEIEDIIEELKYYLFKQAANIIAELILEVIELDILKNSILVPIPIHRRKKWKRGFNQAELIGMKLLEKIDSNKLNIELLNLIKRTRYTHTQVGMRKEDRYRNLKNAFQLDKQEVKKIQGRQIILLDDVMTTGTTLEECAKVLKANGIENVKALVFARG